MWLAKTDPPTCSSNVSLPLREGRTLEKRGNRGLRDYFDQISRDKAVTTWLINRGVLDQFNVVRRIERGSPKVEVEEGDLGLAETTLGSTMVTVVPRKGSATPADDIPGRKNLFGPRYARKGRRSRFSPLKKGFSKQDV